MDENNQQNNNTWGSPQPVPPAQPETPVPPVQPEPVPTPVPPLQAEIPTQTQPLAQTQPPVQSVPPVQPSPIQPMPSAQPIPQPLSPTQPTSASLAGPIQTQNPLISQTENPTNAQTLSSPESPFGTPAQPNTKDSKSNTKIPQGIKNFFKNRTNRVIIIGLLITIIAVIIISVIPTISQNSATKNTNPSEGAASNSEDTSTIAEESPSTSDEDTAKPPAETAMIKCKAQKDFYKLNTVYSVNSGLLDNITITLDLDKVDPETLSEEDKALYANISTFGSSLNESKQNKPEGINITSSDTDASLFLWLKANREKITDETILNNFFGPYDGLTVEEIIKIAPDFAGADLGLICEIE